MGKYIIPFLIIWAGAVAIVSTSIDPDSTWSLIKVMTVTFLPFALGAVLLITEDE